MSHGLQKLKSQKLPHTQVWIGFIQVFFQSSLIPNSRYLIITTTMQTNEYIKSAISPLHNNEHRSRTAVAARSWHKSWMFCAKIRKQRYLINESTFDCNDVWMICQRFLTCTISYAKERFSKRRKFNNTRLIST